MRQKREMIGGFAYVLLSKEQKPTIMEVIGGFVILFLATFIFIYLFSAAQLPASQCEQMQNGLYRCLPDENGECPAYGYLDSDGYCYPDDMFSENTEDNNDYDE